MPPEEPEDLEAWFVGYCRSFYTGEPDHDRNYALKEEHSIRVRDNARLITGGGGVEGCSAALVEAAALLHDIGRFEQYRRFRTFRDADSISHGALGASILKESAAIARFDQEERRALVGSVGLHNVFSLPSALQGATLRLTRVIRDADKLDIWRVFIDFFSLPPQERASAALLGFPETGSCSPDVLAAMEKSELLSLASVKTVDDFRLLQLSWVYDLNSPESARLFLDRGIIGEYARLLPAGKGVEYALENVRRHALRLARQ